MSEEKPEVPAPQPADTTNEKKKEKV